MKHTPNGTRRYTESPVHMTEQEDEQRIETRENGKRRAEDDHQEDESTDQEESDEEQDEEDDEQDEDEPSLKYQRISGAIPDLLKKDSASALAISNKNMVRLLVLF